ncbi:MarR family winged helix-turn-helix transcriptional regulator [Ktedonobacter racemifer]|uniref:Transcriptional regulator, MarR family n=1 Tax=Ktedonobacter racemifer DSM 44963 TaxID=485913 RepID=D6U7N5_KTERA|nr:MarR family transcriptional regulator [Ktedonobacter racemifer]EFH79896.1 transcriptional regulator, MarR family [Ktedonobacter racemifer DSM 44963]
MDLTLVGHLIGGQLIRAGRAHNRVASMRLKHINLYVGQEMLLLSLQREDGLTQSELATIHNVDLSTITKVVQRIERAGLVERRADSNDARISRVYLTEQGRSLCEPSWQMWQDLEKQLTQGLTEAECILLRRLLETVATNLER